MIVEKHDVIIIGGGPAGLAAAVRLKKLGIDDILVLEREKDLGGILRQCIHDGFGLTRFKASLSGPEYASIFIEEAQKLGIAIHSDTSVVKIDADRQVLAVSRNGLKHYQARAIILTMGCRERTRGAIRIPGTRPAGIWTAGVAQAFVNLKNVMVGKKVVILGSGDIGLIIARRMTLEGAYVVGVFEILPFPSGLPRNIVQCLDDYNIPLYLSHTITDIKGKRHLEGVTVSRVDEQMRPIPGTELNFDCDTLILSVGLIPENELSLMAGVDLNPRTNGPVVDENYQTSVPGIFAAGNVLHVHDLVDFVSLEAEKLAASVSEFLQNGSLLPCPIDIQVTEGLGYTVPCKVSGQKDFTLSMRVKKPMRPCRIELRQGERIISTARLPKAIPAEMVQIQVKRANIATDEEITVVVKND